MKKLLIFIILLTFLIPLVSAQDMSYYPSKVAFNKFINSTSSYTVIPGNSEWSISWAHYIDSKLSRFKPRGHDVIVLVGNVYDNPKMKKFWSMTNLSPEKSLDPMIITTGKYVFITGSKENIYLTEKAFSAFYRFTPREKWAAILIFMLIVLLFSYALKKSGYSSIFYLILAFLFAMWMVNSKPFPLSSSMLSLFEKSIEFAYFGRVSSPLSVIIGSWFKLLSPTEEAFSILQAACVLLIISFLYYLAPKRHREYGFIISALVLSSPTFRSYLTTISTYPISILIFTLTLAVALNFTFNPQKVTAVCETLLFALLTIALVYFIPWFLFLPLIFVIAFPKRHVRNYMYLLLSAIGISIIYIQSPFSLALPEHLPHNSITVISRFLEESLIQLLLILYLSKIFIKQGIRKTKGQIPFLMMLLVIYTYITLWNSSLLPFDYILISALSIRMLSQFIPQT